MRKAGAADWRIGTIGFAYDEWHGPFYPPGVSASGRLAAYAERFDAVELDTTFYAIPPVERVKRWAETVPEGFLFSLKAPRDLTHDPRPGWLETEEAHRLARAFRGVAEFLGPKLGAILLQFPPTFGFVARSELAALLETLSGAPLAVELRHASWWRPETEALLREFGATWVAADLAPVGHAAYAPDDPAAPPGYRPLPPGDTGPFVYLRLCGTHAQYPHDDREVADATPRIEWWLDRLTSALVPQRRALAFCGNSFAGHGPATCRRLRDLLGLAEPPSSQGTLF